MTTAELTVLPSLPNCRWRGPATGAGRFGCSSPKLVVSPAGITADDCRVCPFANHPPATAQLRPQPPRPAAPPAACEHRGDDLTVTEKQKIGLPLHKNWAPCAKGRGRNGYVCACEGCGPRCPDYRPADIEPAASPSPMPPPATGPVRLDVTANGIGDHLMAVAVANGWREANPGRPLTLTVKPHIAPWVALFDGYDNMRADKNRLLPDCWPAGFNRGGMHFVEAASRAPWWKMPQLKELPAEAERWAEGFRKAVVFAPFSLGSGNARNWLPSHWRVLEGMLTAAGHRVVAIGGSGDADRLNGFAEPLAGLPPAHVAALVRGSSLVVSNESGMAHLAGAIGAPAVVLAAQLDGQAVHGRWPHSVVLQGPLGCSKCRWTGPQFRDACHTLCASLNAITPELVRDVARQWLDAEWFPDPDLRWHLGKLLIPAPPGHHGPQPDRRATLGGFLRHLDRFVDPRLVETGCQRQANDYGAGMSTTIFGLYLRSVGGRLTSLDLDEANAAVARRVAAGLPVNVIHSDSRPWLRDYAGPPIHGLYLDSCDTWLPGYQEVCLVEAQMALPHLHADAAVLIDDTYQEDGRWHGKGAAAVPCLEAHGFRVIRHHYQALLTR